ncbi:hypothetical protein [Nocardia sp. NPDC005825]|uniref:hypothetical protein n=1 Tax=unclassified Nocardia TaxID=2637762 RepID=UPI0033F9DC29
MLTFLGFVPDAPPPGTFSEVAGNFESPEDLALLCAELERTYGVVRVINTAFPGWQSDLVREEIVFNYTFGFELMHQGIYPTYVLESGGFDYRGATPIGLMLSANKPHTSELMASCGFLCPASVLVPSLRSLEDADLLAPIANSDLVVVKPAYEEASVGLRLLPNDIGDVREAIRTLRAHVPGPFLIQEYIHGIDVTVPVIGDSEPYCLPALALNRLDLDHRTPFVFDAISKRSKRGLQYGPIDHWDACVVGEIYRMACAGFTLTSQRDYARLDCRVDSAGRVWFLEMTPNPEVRPGKASFAVAAGYAGTTFADVMALVIDRKAPQWRPPSATT